MSRIISNVIPSTQILLNSKYATQYISSQTSNCVFSLKDVITRPPQFQMLLSLINLNVPHSYYNINSYNNTLIYTVNSITTTLTITSNNYNINDLVTYLNSYMTGFTITYSSSTNKLTIYNGTYARFSISSSSTCLVQL